MAEVATGLKTLNIADLTQLVRMQEWVAITVYPLLIPFYYLLLLSDGQYASYIGGFAQILIFVLFCGSFAFSLNTVCDLAQDRKAGKQYTLSAWAGNRLLALLLALSAGAVLVLAALAHYDKRFWLLGLLIYLLSAAYSAPLLRLKERPLLGPLTIALTQFALPQLLVFVLFEFYSWETLLFMALFFLAGLRGILFHQVLDYGNDLQASVRTFVTAFGVKRTWHTLTLLTAVEICMLIATLAVCNRTVSGILIYAAGLAALGLLRNSRHGIADAETLYHAPGVLLFFLAYVPAGVWRRISALDFCRAPAAARSCHAFAFGVLPSGTAYALRAHSTSMRF